MVKSETGQSFDGTLKKKEEKKSQKLLNRGQT